MTDKEPTMGTHFTIPKPELRDIIADRILEHYPLADRKLALHIADHITPLISDDKRAVMMKVVDWVIDHYDYRLLRDDWKEFLKSEGIGGKRDVG